MLVGSFAVPDFSSPINRAQVVVRATIRGTCYVSRSPRTQVPPLLSPFPLTLLKLVSADFFKQLLHKRSTLVSMLTFPCRPRISLRGAVTRETQVPGDSLLQGLFPLASPRLSSFDLQ
jgi:hypothetical protein